MIDLHLHTTASDGRCTPEDLVARVAANGIRVMSVTDHDTRAAEASARASAAAAGVELIPGIEITAVHRGKDMHMLAYGLPPEAPELDAVIARQRQRRLARALEIAERLTKLGVPVDFDDGMAGAQARSGKALARPQIAQWLVNAGHVSSIAEAFDRYLNEGAPAYVPHCGISPAETVSLVARCGGVASLAHPARIADLGLIIGGLVESGLRCIEAYHSSHDERAQQTILNIAQRYDLGVTGGSDFHGDGTRYAECFGKVGLPEDQFIRFREILEGARVTAATQVHARAT